MTVEARPAGARLRPTSRARAAATAAAFFVLIALATVATGLLVGAWLESTVFGFIVADFVFLIAVAVYTSVKSGANGRHP